MTDRTPEPGGRTAGNALLRLLLDVRVIIGGLFCVYGLIIAIVGLFETPSGITKAVGVNINLWTGLAMLVVGVVFLLWAFLRPPRRGLPDSPPRS
jgi:xanthine/uracil/vitamin C permease (AzgA family)